MYDTQQNMLALQRFAGRIASLDHIRRAVTISLVTVFSALIFLVGFVLISYARMLLKRSTLPPGPFPLPIVGNCLQLSRSKPWLQFKQWSRDYNSGLITIWIGRTPTIICNDAWCTSDLLEKRSNIYSSRPHYIVFGDLTGQSDTNQVLLAYNDHWRLQRRIMHTALGSQALRPYKVFQADESRVLMRDLLTDPINFAHHSERYAASLVSILGWARRIDNMDDYILKFALKMMDDITMMQVPGNYWMEAIPELQYLPAWIYPLPTQLRNFGKVIRKFWWALDCEAASKEQESFSKLLVNSKEDLTSDAIGEMTANLIGGGFDTSSSTLHTLILGMCLSPEVQKKARAELDAVVGKDRSPDWEDLENLPYCLAVFKEAMRWRSVTTLGGFAHAPIKDDTYNGYILPAGIHVYGNLWAIHSNPKDFPEPDMFKPERFLEERLPYPTKQGHHAFGWGRRSCSGQYFAEQGLSMTIVRLLWAFEILPGLDDEGREVKLDMWAYTDNENTQPLPFEARFLPRSEKIKDIINEEAVLARDRLKNWDGVSGVTVEQFIQEE